MHTLIRWLPLALAPVCAFAAVAAVVWLHQVRPTGDLIRLDSAAFQLGLPLPDDAAPPGKVVTLPHDWRAESVPGPTGWYRFEMDFNIEPDRLWGLYIPALEMTPAVYVNDIAVGGFAGAYDPLPRHWNRPVLYSVPNGLLGQGRNRIDVVLRANGPWGRLTEIYVGPREHLQASYDRRHFWRVTFLNVTTVGCLMLAVFMLALSAASRDRVYLWFAAFAFAWYLQNVFILTVQVPVSNVLWDFASYVIYGAMLATGSIFAFRFLDEPHPVWERLVLVTALAGPAALLILMMMDTTTFNTVGGLLWLGMLLALAFYPVLLIGRAVSSMRTPEMFFLSVCFLLTVMLGSHDWMVTTGLGYRHNGMLMQFAAAPTLATLGVILLRRFVGALRETEALNRELEQRVADKAREIEATFARNQELESAQLLSRERERLMRDMHDGVGSQLIGMLGHLDVSTERDRVLAGGLNLALHDLRLMIDSLDDIENDVAAALGLFRNRVQPQLDAAGLCLQWQVGDLPAVPDLGPERVLHFFRLLQETLTNCIKHSGARHIRIETRPDGLVNGRRCVCVAVSDDGHGFNQPNGNGRGLANMRYRSTAAGLELSMKTSARGTTVVIGFPLPAGPS